MRRSIITLAALLLAPAAWAQPHSTPPSWTPYHEEDSSPTNWIDQDGVWRNIKQAHKTHHVVIQIDQDDPAVMNLALNNAQNMQKYYAAKGEKVEIEFVAFGNGLAMVRSDTSPVKERLAALSHQGIVFSGCGNTKAKQTLAEEKNITLLPEAREVPTGVARITELEEQGWTYLRP
jgi:intracellular sulfur oxidation DsrE/DsrF family protein